MSWLGWGVCRLWRAAALLLFAPPALAANPSIELTIAPDTAETRPLERVVRELLAEQQVEVQATFAAEIDPRQIVRELAPSANPTRLARVWVDLAELDRCMLYIAEGGGERLLVRRLPRAESWELARESAARVLSTALEALLSGARIGLTREHWVSEFGLNQRPAAPRDATTGPVEPAPEPEPERDEPALLRAEAALGYEAAGYASPFELAHGPLVELALTRSVGRGRAVTLLVAGQYRLPMTAQTSGLDIRLGSEALRVMGRFEQRLLPRLSAFAGIGAALDLLHFSARSIGSGSVRAAPDKSFSLPMVRGALGAELQVLADVAIWGELSLDWDNSKTRFVVQTASGRREILSLWTYRPALCAGVWIPL